VLAGLFLASICGHGEEQDVARAIASRADQLEAPRHASTIAALLTPTSHPPLPGHPSLFWLVPFDSAQGRPEPASRGTGGSRRPDETALGRFARGAKLFKEGDYAGALPLFSERDLASTPVADYALYYAAATRLRLLQLDEADAAFEALEERKPLGYLTEGIPLRRAELAEARGNVTRALALLEPLTREKVSAPEDLLLRIARLAEAAGDREKALGAYRRVYFEFPLSDQALEAEDSLKRLEADLVTPERFKLELGRAERLFGSRRYPAAREAFYRLARIASGDDKELVALRIAESDYYLQRYRASRDALKPYLDDSPREAEARFFHLTATRAIGEIDTYLALARGLVDDVPESSWAEETLNNLASHYLIVNEDANADVVFRELYRRFPQGRHSERAAWKIGWWAYKNGQLADAATFFEGAAAAFPRADTRPAWLYWAARARDQLGEGAAATERYRLVATDYLNSYYGRLAWKRLEQLKEPPVPEIVTAASTSEPLPPTDALIRQLVGLELYDDALKELEYARRVWGDSPAIQATFGFIYHQQGDLRRGINAVKRAYPQYLASGGEELPVEVLRVLFPVDYWPLIKKYSETRNLDPYVISALMAQESTFDADIRSAANAIGLMQVVPATGRRYARTLGIRRFSAMSLTDAETNVRIGTAYFKDLVDRFGGAHFALASYNAGEHRIARWISERPGLAQDEFIDDIPFPETQNYVKKILGTAEDYRRLYGGGLLVPGGRNQAAPAAVATPAKAPAGKKPVAKKPAAKKPAAKKPVTKKPAPKKPARG
jgi:soluble lytic murein transglycosylase